MSITLDCHSFHHHFVSLLKEIFSVFVYCSNCPLCNQRFSKIGKLWLSELETVSKIISDAKKTTANTQIANNSKSQTNVVAKPINQRRKTIHSPSNAEYVQNHSSQNMDIRAAKTEQRRRTATRMSNVDENIETVQEITNTNASTEMQPTRRRICPKRRNDRQITCIVCGHSFNNSDTDFPRMRVIVCSKSCLDKSNRS